MIELEHHYFNETVELNNYQQYNIKTTGWKKVG